MWVPVFLVLSSTRKPQLGRVRANNPLSAAQCTRQTGISHSDRKQLNLKAEMLNPWSESVPLLCFTGMSSKSLWEVVWRQSNDQPMCFWACNFTIKPILLGSIICTKNYPNIQQLLFILVWFCLRYLKTMPFLPKWGKLCRQAEERGE